MKFATKAIHAGQEPDPSTGSIMTPIYQTATYAQAGLGEHKGFEYSRTSNPTRAALEACIAALEEGAYGLAFASGMAAESAILSLLSAGDHVVSCDDTYGGTYRIFERVMRRYNVEFSYVPADKVANYEKAVRPNTKMIWLETPTNRLLRLIDIQAITALAKRQMSGFGGMVSFQFKGTYQDVKQMVRRFKVFTLAESLGGVESLVCHPASMTHGSIPKDIRESRGLTDTLLRLSVGIEDIEDIIADLEQALASYMTYQA